MCIMHEPHKPRAAHLMFKLKMQIWHVWMLRLRPSPATTRVVEHLWSSAALITELHECSVIIGQRNYSRRERGNKNKEIGAYYAVISSVASRPIMCKIARRPPGCLSSHELRRRTYSSKITIVSPSAIMASTASGDKI